MKIFVESKYAKMVLKVLGLPEAVLTRGHGKEDVIKKIIDCEGEMGMIDADPEHDEPRPLGEFEKVKECPEKNELRKMKRKTKFLVVVVPCLREWLAYTLTRRYGKSPEDFGLPNEPGRLKKVVGRPSGRRALAKCAEWLKEQAKEIQNLKECLECLHRD